MMIIYHLWVKFHVMMSFHLVIIVLIKLYRKLIYIFNSKLFFRLYVSSFSVYYLVCLIFICKRKWFVFFFFLNQHDKESICVFICREFPAKLKPIFVYIYSLIFVVIVVVIVVFHLLFMCMYLVILMKAEREIWKLDVWS